MMTCPSLHGQLAFGWTACLPGRTISPSRRAAPSFIKSVLVSIYRNTIFLLRGYQYTDLIYFDRFKKALYTTISTIYNNRVQKATRKVSENGTEMI